MATPQEMKAVLQSFQSQRLRRDHADLAAEPQYHEIAEFFFDEMYGPRDFKARDEQAHRLHQFVHLAPGLNIGDVQNVLELLDLTNMLDDLVVQRLNQLGAPLDFDEPLYERAYREADNYSDRVHQIELARHALYNVYRMAKRPLIGAVLNRTHGLAQTVGMADIHRFLRLGFNSIQSVRDIHRFVETVCVREQDRLDRIYDV
ncbi:MAG TPA: hypothetical protein PLO33_02955 [Kouleothrix sp.]|uniref:FFLEELY motif protein n=1 Tax=Kouleothrix sp. TaxID=2779161 RepID=UPI002CA74510|nr:hypothetical protein [Kouleothrix sp.]HRC74607.1 hypothetical protein [Kouleothrix sp.]